MGWIQYVLSVLQAGNTIINPKGIFVYNGPPALGNLIVSIAPAAGTDDFGNSFPQGFKCTVGEFDVPNIRVNGNGLFIYSGTPAAGNLIFSFTNTNPQPADAFGNNVLSGCAAYDNAGLQAIQWAAPSTFFYFTMTAQPGAAFTGQNATLSFGQNGAVGTFFVGIAPFLQLNTVLAQPNLTNLASGSLQIGGDANGHASLASGTEAAIYRVGHLVLTKQTALVNSTSFTTELTFAAVPGIYHIRGNMRYTGSQAAGAPAFQVAFTGTASEITEFTRWSTTGNPTTDKTGIFIAFGSADIGPTLLNGTNQWYEFELWTTVSASGSFNFQAADQTAGDTWNINRLFVEIEHILCHSPNAASSITKTAGSTPQSRFAPITLPGGSSGNPGGGDNLAPLPAPQSATPP